MSVIVETFTRQSSCGSNFYRTFLRFSVDSLSYVDVPVRSVNGKHTTLIRDVLKSFALILRYKSFIEFVGYKTGFTNGCTFVHDSFRQ